MKDIFSFMFYHRSAGFFTVVKNEHTMKENVHKQQIEHYWDFEGKSTSLSSLVVKPLLFCIYMTAGF